MIPQSKATSQPVIVADSKEVQRVLWRLSRELQERHPQGDGVTLCGIVTRGVHIAERLQELLEEHGDASWQSASLDVGPYRDDLPRKAFATLRQMTLPAATRQQVEDRTLVLVDDVLYHGRTARAALVALADLGRPRSVELLVLVDRGHRELPLRATYVGKNLPTSKDQVVRVRLRACDGEDSILVENQGGFPGK